MKLLEMMLYKGVKKLAKVTSVAKMLIVLCGIALITACTPQAQDSYDNPPPLSAEQMIFVLADMHIAEAYQQQARIDKDSTFNSTRIKSLYGKVLSTNKVSADDFVESFNWYAAHPKLLDELYSKVSNRLTTLEVANKTK